MDAITALTNALNAGLTEDDCFELLSAARPDLYAYLNIESPTVIVVEKGRATERPIAKHLTPGGERVAVVMWCYDERLPGNGRWEVYRRMGVL